MKNLVFILISMSFITVKAQDNFSGEESDTLVTPILNEVVIEGDMQYTSSNKTIYLPDRNSKRTAQNAADLLSKMAIPQIVVNPSSGDV